MRGFSHAALTAASLALFTVACSDGTRSEADVPSAPSTDAPSFSVYDIGDLGRAVPNPCAAQGSRQFDFWVGKWNVNGATGLPVATSVISSEMDDCLVMEDYIQNGGFRGRSLSVYDATAGRWYQTFVDNIIAASFRLSGALEGGKMVLTGSQPVYNFATGTVRQRDVTVTWTPLDGGRVNQRFDASFDGAPATTTFDGTYLPASELTRATPAVFRFCQGAIPQFLQLDFWLGAWSVAAEPGQELGTSRVTSDLNHCLIQEDFASPKGYRSRSFVYFDFVVEKWFRTFADNTGAHAELSGELAGDAMVMTGQETGTGGKARDVRVTIAPDGTGAVRQRWESSTDAGATWKPDVTLLYRQ